MFEDSPDRRRPERGFRELGSQSPSFLMFQLASSITAASKSVIAAAGGNPQQVRIYPTTFTVNVLQQIGTNSPPDNITAIDNSQSPKVLMTETVANYDLSLEYTLPSDVTTAPFGVAALIDGVWVLIYIGC